MFSEHYSVLGPLGKGANGSVLRAVHNATQTEVAVKVATDGHLGAYRREILALVGLSHPRIARVMDHGAFDATGWDGLGTGAHQRWYCMPLASGGSLEDQHPTGWPQVRLWLQDLLDGLAKLHARGIVHRDIKPANILFGGPDDLQPGLIIADFGITWDQHQITTPRAGTPGFMAPEQVLEGGHIGPWTDLHAVGMVIWWCVTGSVPFYDPDPHTHVRRSMTLDLPPMQTLFPCPDDLEAWITTCCERDVHKRLHRVADARAALACLDSPQAPVDTYPLPISAPHLFPLLLTDPMERPHERRKLWTAITKGLSSPGPTIVELTGPEGSGRRNMAIWAGECAHMEGYHFLGLEHLHHFPQWAANFLPNPSTKLQAHLDAVEITMGDVRVWHTARAVEEMARERPVLFMLHDPEILDALAGLLAEIRSPVVLLIPSAALQADVTIALGTLSSASLRRVLRQRIVGEEARIDEAIAQSGGLPGRAVTSLAGLLVQRPDDEETISLDLANTVNGVLASAAPLVQRAIERAAMLEEQVELDTWAKVWDGPAHSPEVRVTAEKLLKGSGLARLEARQLIFRPGVRQILLALASSSGHLDQHWTAVVEHIHGPRRAVLLLDAGRATEASAALAEVLPQLYTREGPHACLAQLRRHEAQVPLSAPLRVAKVRYLANAEMLRPALDLANACLAEPHPPADHLELLRWNAFCRRRLGREPGPAYDALYAAAIEQHGRQALLALRSSFRGLTAMGRWDSALAVLNHVDACATGREDEREVRGELDAQRAQALGDVDALERASKLIESGAQGAPQLLRLAWEFAVEVHQVRGDLGRARRLVEKMMQIDETHSPVHNMGFNLATLACIEVEAGDHSRARTLTEAARSRCKDPRLARRCSHLDVVLAAGVDASAAAAALARILEAPVAVSAPSDLRLLSLALAIEPDQPAVRARLEQQVDELATRRRTAGHVLGLSPDEAGR